jgi:acyl-CoA reductase-like NAD-dependent aldehyde dehydrogenase
MNKPGDLPLTAQSLARHFIGNAWVRATEARSIPVIDPATGEIFAEIAR